MSAMIRSALSLFFDVATRWMPPIAGLKFRRNLPI